MKTFTVAELRSLFLEFLASLEEDELEDVEDDEPEEYALWNTKKNRWVGVKAGGEAVTFDYEDDAWDYHEEREFTDAVEVRPYKAVAPVFGVWNNTTNSWMRSSYHGGDRTFASHAEAHAKIAQKQDSRNGHNWEDVEVRPYSPATGNAVAPQGMAVGTVKTAERWGIWNSETYSWMHTHSHTGTDRVYSTLGEAIAKIQAKAKGPTGRNWIHCTARVYTGNPEASLSR